MNETIKLVRMKDYIVKFSSGYTGSIRRVCCTAGAGEERFTETKIIFARNKNLLRMTKY